MGIQLWLLRSLTALVAAFVAVALLVAAVATEGEGPGDSFESQARSAGAPGGVSARIADGRVVETQTFGDVTPGSRFLWGSVSKPVAALVAQDAAAEGLLDLDAPVRRYDSGAPPVTVRSLLGHTSGLPFGAPELDHDRPTATARASLPHPTPALSSVGTYRYSSLGYVYVQAAVEAATHGPYEAALRRSLPGTSIGASAESCSDITSPHRLVGPWALPIRGGYDGAGAAYGYACGSIRDLAALAGRHLSRPDVGRTTPTGHAHQAMGQGWRVTREADGRTTHWHTGTVPGYFTAVYVDPDTRDGSVVLLDSSGFLHEEQLAAVTRATYDRATGRTPTPIPNGLVAGVPVVLLALALLVIALAVHTGRGGHGDSGGRIRVASWAAALVATSAALAAAPPLLGYPARYVWLWEPGLAIGAVAMVAALALGTALTATRARRGRGLG